jgi:hypothetical protein
MAVRRLRTAFSPTPIEGHYAPWHPGRSSARTRDSNLFLRIPLTGRADTHRNLRHPSSLPRRVNVTFRPTSGMVRGRAADGGTPIGLMPRRMRLPMESSLAALGHYGCWH